MIKWVLEKNKIYKYLQRRRTKSLQVYEQEFQVTNLKTPHDWPPQWNQNKYYNDRKNKQTEKQNTETYVSELEKRLRKRNYCTLVRIKLVKKQYRESQEIKISPKHTPQLPPPTHIHFNIRSFNP